MDTWKKRFLLLDTHFRFTVLISGACVSLLLCWLAAAPLAVARAERQDEGLRVLVGPNILVTADGASSHAELIVAAHPTNPKHLLGAAIDLKAGNRTYVSVNGGNRWLETSPGGDFRYKYASADPQVAFTPRGTALFVSMDNPGDRSGESQPTGNLHLYRSEDGGMTWQPPVTINPGPSCDHPQLAVDQTTGRHAGAVYVGAACPQDPGGRNEWDISVFRSLDDGKTFSTPVRAMPPPPSLGGKGVVNQVAKLLVLRDGTLFVGSVDLGAVPNGDRLREMRSVVSGDAGVTFSAPAKVGSVVVNRISAGRGVDLTVFAAGTEGERFRDRIHVVWDDQRSGRSLIMASHSDDQGRSWTEPKQVDAAAPPGAQQYLPAVVVNTLGIVGITWYDTRAAGPEGVHSEFFAASADGGASFLPAVEVSSREAYPQKDGVLLVANTPRLAKAKGVMRLRFIERGKQWPGHYHGLTAGADGTFHAFWSDTRTGRYQIWASRIVVQRGRQNVDVKKVNAVVTDKLALAVDPVSYDPVTKEAMVPVRLENTSSTVIYPPIVIEFTSLGPNPQQAAIYDKRPEEAGWRQDVPEILNATNGKTGTGAIVDFSAALGGFDSLAPGARTGAVVWRLKMVNPARSQMFDMDLRVTALVAETGAK